MKMTITDFEIQIVKFCDAAKWVRGNLIWIHPDMVNQDWGEWLIENLEDKYEAFCGHYPKMRVMDFKIWIVEYFAEYIEMTKEVRAITSFVFRRVHGNDQGS